MLAVSANRCYVHICTRRTRVTFPGADAGHMRGRGEENKEGYQRAESHDVFIEKRGNFTMFEEASERTQDFVSTFFKPLSPAMF